MTAGLFFAAGADNAALRKVAIASVFGSVAALLVMGLSFKTADLPDFWGIALWVGVLAFALVMFVAAGDWYYAPATFPAFASVVFWWIATGLDGWAPGGGGVGNSPEALGDPAAAGAGAFGGVLSTPWVCVWFDVMVTLLLGCLLGWAMARITALVTPEPRQVAEGRTEAELRG